MAYSYMQQWARKNPEYRDWLRRQATGWRREPTVKRIPRPTRLDRARILGYRAKQGMIVVRVRIRRGGARKSRPVSGRRQKAMGVVKYTREISIQKMAERRANRKYPNLSLRDSYHVYSDGKNHWYEIVLKDLNHPALK